MDGYVDPGIDEPPSAAAPTYSDTAKDEPEVSDAELALVKRLQERVDSWTYFHRRAFKQMRDDMTFVRRGAIKGWPESNYVANIVGRHINQRVAALYAKNPTAVFRARKRKDFKVWDETPETLVMANGIVQQAMLQYQAAVAAGDMMAQFMGPQAVMQQPGVAEAAELLEDVQQGMTRKQMIRNFGETLELVYAYYTGEQMPVNLKTELKAAVRRAATCGVAYVKLGFQRQYGARPDVASRLSDVTYRLNHLRSLAEKARDGDIDKDAAEIAELQFSLQTLTAEPEVIVREGLVFDFPDATSIIPDPMTKRLRGFVGARGIFVRHLMTCEEVHELYGVDLKGSYTGYTAGGSKAKNGGAGTDPLQRGDNNDEQRKAANEDDLVCVYEHYDKASGLKYEFAAGHRRFLKPPGPPDVLVEDFWPVYALTFNEIEDEGQLFPPSDAFLMLHEQHEYNLSRQGKRDHRRANRPRYVAGKSVFDEEDKKTFMDAEPFSVSEVNAIGQNEKITDKLMAIPVVGVDPNMYDVGEIMTDISLTVGTSEAAFGMAGKATATGEGIAEAARAGSTNSNVDDLDDFLALLARAGGQILVREASPEKVMSIVGAGAVWPELTAQELADEVYLTTEAGSSGRPNQATEIQNFEKLAPILVQIPGIKPAWLAKQAIKRLDDRLDPTEAYVEGLPSIAVGNAPAGGAQAGAQAQGAAGQDPRQQGAAGAQNAPMPQGGPPGTAGQIGNNQL